MAPRKGTKRAADTQAPPADQPLEKKVSDFIKSEGISMPVYKSVVEGLGHPLLTVPIEVREMLLAMTPKTLCVAANDRHELQQQGVEMIGDAMSEVQAKLQGELDVEQAKLDELDSSKAELERNAQQAKAFLVVVSDSTKTKTQELAAVTEAMLAAKNALQSKQEVSSKLNGEYLQIRADRDALEASVAKDFKTLCEGSWEEGQSKKYYDTLASLFGKFHLDESLLAVLPGPLLKKPEERGSFDLMAVTQLDETLKKKLNEWAVTLEKEAPEVSEREAAVAAAQKGFDQAGEAQSNAAGALKIAQDEEKAAAASVVAADAVLAESEASSKKAAELRDQKKTNVEMFEYNIGNFAILKERVSAVAKTQESLGEGADAKPAEAGA